MPTTNSNLYSGIMSGTSADGVDIALVDFANDSISLLAQQFHPYNQSLKQQITSLYQPSTDEIDRAFTLDKELAHFSLTPLALFWQPNNLRQKILPPLVIMAKQSATDPAKPTPLPCKLLVTRP